MENKYNTKEAIEFRNKLERISARIAELQYESIMLQKDAKKIGDEYAIYLGLKEPEEKKEEFVDVKES